MSTNRWMDKEVVVHIYNGILLSHKNEWNNSICSNMERPREYILSELIQTKTNIIWYHLYVESKIRHKWTYLQNRNIQTQRTDLWLPRGREGGRVMDWEFEVSRCKLLHLEWINNKVLLYSTGNYIQSPGINHNGKEYKKKNVYMCITESLCCTTEISTTL